MQIAFTPRNRRIQVGDALGLVGLVGLLIARFIPVARLIPFWGCKFRQITGYPCPGCGLTRVADRVAHFHFLAALKANPLGTIAALGFFVLAGWMVLHLLFRVPMLDVDLSEAEWKKIRWAAPALFVANYAWVVFSYRELGWR
jgi:Protein of unknown function (DUF2752)